MRIKKAAAVILLLGIGIIAVSGCGGSKEKSKSDPVFIETPTPSPTPTPFVDPELNKNDTGKTIIRAVSKNRSYPNNSYMIITQQGTVICADPSQCIDGVKPDIITSTHSHADHQDANLERKFPECRVSKFTMEDFEVYDVKVSTVASTHGGDNISEKSPANVIYVFEADGLRIAHMGDIGQSSLTEEQLTQLGQIDIAFMQFVNTNSQYTVENEKGFTVIEQLKPQIIIPTHSSAEANSKIGEIVGAYEEVDDMIAVSKDDLTDGTRKVIKINNTNVNR